MVSIESFYPVISFIVIMYTNRGRIYNKLKDTKVGTWIMAPILVPYVIYVIFKLSRDPYFIASMGEANKQKKLDDFS